MIDCKKSKNHGWYDESKGGCKWCEPVVAVDWQAVLREWNITKSNRTWTDARKELNISNQVTDADIEFFWSELKSASEEMDCDCGDPDCGREDEDPDICEYSWAD